MKGQWYTDENGNHYFVENGQSPKEGWEASKRRKMISKGKYNVSEDGENYKEVSKDDYDKYEADETEFDETVDDDFGFDEDDNSLESYLSSEGISESFANGIREAALNGKESLENYLAEEGISSSYAENLYNLVKNEEDEDLTDAVVDKVDEENNERFTLGGDKRLTDEKDIAKMNELSEALKKAGLDNKLEEGWEDAGANMKWHNLTSNGTWVLDPSQWMDYMNGKKSADEIVNELKTNGYFKDKFKLQNADANRNNDPVAKIGDKELKLSEFAELSGNAPKELQDALISIMASNYGISESEADKLITDAYFRSHDHNGKLKGKI